MHHLYKKQHAFSFPCVANILCAFLLLNCVDGYIMPVCSEKGGVCLDKTAEGECAKEDELKITKVSELFSFVTKTVEVTKRWIYDQVFTVCYIFCKAPEEPQKQPTYFEAVRSFFGFGEEPKQKEVEYTSYNPYVFGAILTLYFAYVFMAAKCFTWKKTPQKKPDKTFLPFLAKENNRVREDDAESEDESTIVFESKCAECNHSNLSSYLTGDANDED